MDGERERERVDARHDAGVKCGRESLGGGQRDWDYYLCCVEALCILSVAVWNCGVGFWLRGCAGR